MRLTAGELKDFAKKEAGLDCCSESKVDTVIRLLELVFDDILLPADGNQNKKCRLG